MVKKHIVFDFGAVLFRWQPVELLQQAIPEHAPDEAQARHWMDRVFKGFTGHWARFDAGLITPEDLVPVLAAESGLPAPALLALMQAIPAHLSALPDTVALIDELAAAGHRLFFLSNMPVPYADYLEATQPVIQRFEAGVFSGRVGLVKPDQAIFDLALARFGVAAADCVFLDDHPANIAAARAAGWGAIAFSHAAQARAELPGHGVVL